MIKAILLDADGVTIKKHGFFSEKYSREYNVPIEKIIPFFRNEFKACQLGAKDLREELPKYLKEWGWHKSIDDFLMYWFESDTVPDEEVIDKIQEIRASGIKCYLVTDQEKYRADYIRKDLGFDSKLDGCFFSCEVGHSKEESEFFVQVLAEVGLSASEIMYLDDDEENLVAAEKSGITTKFYRGLDDLVLIDLYNRKRR